MKVTLEDLLNFKTINMLHDVIIKETGGLSGIHNKNLIESSLIIPLQKYFGKEIYPTPIEKAGALFYSIIKNHGFADGNKRTACLMLTIILVIFGYKLIATNLMLEDVAIKVADNKISQERALLWVYRNIDFIKKK